jgi:hypothetical protein
MMESELKRAGKDKKKKEEKMTTIKFKKLKQSINI